MVDPAIQAEADWLNADTTVTGLLAPTGVLPYIRENPPAGQRVCWLFRTRLEETRVANQLKRLTHSFQLRIKWPLESAGATVIEAQTSMDGLVQALLSRVRGSAQDKTHGYFSWVGESVIGQGVPGIQVTFTDVEQCLRQSVPWQADIVYTAVQDSISA